MKALSIKQPWAYLIAAGIKDIENRTWKTNYRGKFLIHAPQKAEKLHLLELFTANQRALLNNKRDITNHSVLTYIVMRKYLLSSIIGECEIVDCIQNSKSVWAESGCWHFILKNAMLYDKPIMNIKGALNFWNYDK